MLEVLRSQPRNVLITTGLRMSQIGLFVLLTTYSLTYLQDSFGKGSGVGLIAVLISSALGLVSTPGWALLSDRLYGAKSDSIGQALSVFAGTLSIVALLGFALVWLALRQEQSGEKSEALLGETKTVS